MLVVAKRPVYATHVKNIIDGTGYKHSFSSVVTKRPVYVTYVKVITDGTG